MRAHHDAQCCSEQAKTVRWCLRRVSWYQEKENVSLSRMMRQESTVSFKVVDGALKIVDDVFSDDVVGPAGHA